ncbi:DUF488 domain-containing protein [Desulfovibrio sulfodismutans]|uniref:DUF488 domain-containing protein n=1 Tax=Desulfolutivibrio sulfodismutans TaxID=63561 RepID=A0A7K3NPQ3_9BACT|nr:DUF488 domain-containing protein [Desulfolutivibrio sulfodismutans]NDY58164.1 DUF488 domain-containing protein [Desulfolutivibrio sulfodismutans]
MLYTIGYTSYDVPGLIAVVQKLGITAIADVRSMPYSALHPEYNRDKLKEILRNSGVQYVFLGDLVGARYDDPDVYDGNAVDYARVSRLPTFRKGLERIVDGATRHVIALMCAEKDPVTCHRMILICRNMRNELSIRHILADGKVESHEHAELRLMRLFGLDRLDLLGRSEQERLEDAYQRQGKLIAYKADAPDAAHRQAV